MTSRNIPQFRSYLEQSDYESIERVFTNRYIAEGPVAVEFVEKLLGVIGSPYGSLAANGTLALYMALKALNIGPGDEVIVQDTTFIATANAVEMVGARPVFVDILAPTNLSIDLSKIEINKNTKAVMIAHLFGTACTNTQEVKVFCEANNLYLVEDAAQAFVLLMASNTAVHLAQLVRFRFLRTKHYHRRGGLSGNDRRKDQYANDVSSESGAYCQWYVCSSGNWVQFSHDRYSVRAGCFSASQA